MHHPGTEEEFNGIMETAGDKPVLLKFSAEWCGPCQMIAGHMKTLAEENPHMVFVHVDVDALDEVSQRYGIECMPTIKLFVEKKQVGEKVEGASMDKIKALVALAPA